MTDQPAPSGSATPSNATPQPSASSPPGVSAGLSHDGLHIDRGTIENAISTARSDLAAAENELTSLQADLQETQQHREQLEQRCEALRAAISRLEDLARTFRERAGDRLYHVDHLEQELTARLANAKAAIEAYWTTNPDAKAFAEWRDWTPAPGRPVTPDVLRERLNVSVEHMREAITYFADRNPSFRKTLLTLQAEYQAARGPVDRDLAQCKANSYFAGKAGEFIVQSALAPMCGRMTTDVRRDLEAGSYTKVDVVMEDLRCPVIFGRGEGRGAVTGGSAAIEIKWGRSDYLEKQREHMVTQAEGHQHYDTSATLCSRDIHSAESQAELRDSLRNAGSPLLAILPEKHQLDSACWQAITTYTPPMESA